MRLFETIRQDARHAIRLLLQNRGFAAVAILSLPVHDPERLVVFALDPDDPSVGSNYPDYVYIRDHNKSFSGVIAHGGGGGLAAMEVPQEGAHATAQLVNTSLVSGNFFDVLGVTPAAGRLLKPSDNTTEDGHPWVVLDYSFWQRRFAGDRRVIGRAITL